MSNEAVMVNTPAGIQMFQLLAVRGALRLEKLGMKHSRGSVRKMWAVHLGMKPTTKIDIVIAKVEEMIQALEG